MTITNVTIVSDRGLEHPAVIDQDFGIVTLHEGEEQPWVRALRARAVVQGFVASDADPLGRTHIDPRMSH